MEAMLSSANPLRKHKRNNQDHHSLDDETARKSYAEVGAGCGLYADLLRAEDTRVQVAAAFLLAWFPAHAWSVAPAASWP